MQINVEWSSLKSFVVARGLSIQEVVTNGRYYLCAIDGPMELTTQIIKTDTPQAGTDEKDYVDNFQPKKNKTPANNVTTRLEKADRTRKYWSFKATASKAVDSSTPTSTAFLIKAPGSMSVNASMVFQESLTNDRLVFGGKLWEKTLSMAIMFN